MAGAQMDLCSRKTKVYCKPLTCELWSINSKTEGVTPVPSRIKLTLTLNLTLTIKLTLLTITLLLRTACNCIPPPNASEARPVQYWSNVFVFPT